MGEVLVEARGLSRQFGKKRVVDDVSFTLHAGAVTGFVGANGAGKTTTLRIMLGLLPGGGVTSFMERPLEAWSVPSSVVGAVFGGIAGHPKHTVRSHLRMVATGAGVPDTRVDELLETVGMASAAGQRLAKLSLGMTQRVGIAQALIGDPRVLVLDEPANGLDPHAIKWLRTFLRERADAGTAVMVSSHLLSEMEQLADEVIVLARGRVVAQERMADLVERAAGSGVVKVQTPQLAKLASLVKVNGGALEADGAQDASITGLTRIEVGDLAAENGIPLYWLHEEKPSLEDFYLSVAEEEFKIS